MKSAATARQGHAQEENGRETTGTGRPLRRASEEADGGENAEVTCMKVCMFFKLRNGKKWSCVVITRPLPTNGGLKLIGQCATSGNGIKPRFLMPCGKYGQLKGDANLFSFDGSSMGESTGRFLLKCCRYMDAYASTRV